jgi:4-amino-4-deoxy-L-arabinose transferase-like glycosyltransferase
MPGKNYLRGHFSFLLAAAAVGLVLRLAFSLGYWVNEPLTRDEVEYLSLARSLAAGQGFRYDELVRDKSPDPFGRAPGYPAFLALVGGGRVTDGVPASVKIAQALVGAIGIVGIGLFAGRLAGPRAARAAAALAACYPPLVWYAGYALSEALFWPIALATAWTVDMTARADTARPDRWALAAGFVTGLAALVRAATVPFLVLTVAWFLWRRWPRRAAAFALGAMLVIGPWTVRNYRAYGHFVLIATDGGVTFWTGNNALQPGDGDMAANPQMKLASQALRRQYPGLTEEQFEPIYYREAFAWIRDHPVDWLVLEARKLFYTIVPVGPSYRLHSWRYFGASVASYALVLPIAVLGAFWLGRRRAETPGLWLMAASAILVCLVFFPQERFKVPVIDPTLIICASVAWASRRDPLPS